MGLTRRWRFNFADVLDWSAVDKGILLPLILIPIYAQYLLWAGYVLLRDDRTLLADVVFLEGQGSVVMDFIVGALALLALGAALRRRWPDARWYQYLCALYYSLTLMYCGYIIGALSFAAGVVLVGAPLVGFILLDRAVVYVAWAAAVVAMLVASYAGAIGLVQYAPAIVPPVPGDSANQLFWTTSTIYFAAPHLVIIMALADFLLGRWREREKAFRTLSYTDVLTGVHNRRSVLQLLEREVAKRHRRGAPVSVVLVDLDHFKQVNDTWGHPAGDRVLTTASAILADCLRQSDALGRVGGEEFLLVLPDTDIDGARVIAERCRQRLAETNITAENGVTFQVTGSFGISGNARDPGIAVDALVAAADDALYRAKQNGRNRVEAA